MPQTNLMLHILATHQALFEIEFQELFGLQVDDVFPSTHTGATILLFRIDEDQAKEDAPLQLYLEQRQAARMIIEMTPPPNVSCESGASMPSLRVHSSMLYALDEERAREFDAIRPPSRKRFATLLPGSNAYLLEYDDFESQKYPDLDPGEAEPGCFVPLDQGNLSEEKRQRLLDGLISQGYAVSLFPEALLITAWHRDVLTGAVEHDIQRILTRR